MRRIGVGARRLGVAALLAGSALLAAPRLAPSGLTIEFPGGRLAIGRVALPGSPLAPLAGLFSARAQADAPVLLEDFAYTAGTATLRAPRVELHGTALSRADFAAIVDPASAEPWPARLSRLSAERIVVPEFTVEQTVNGAPSRAVYKGLEARGVAAGRVATFEAAGVDLAFAGGEGHYGHLSARDVDLPEVVRLYAEPAGPGGTPPLKRLYGAVVADAITFRDAHGVEFGIGHAEMRDLAARPVRGGWTEAGALLARAADPATPSDERRRALATGADLLEAFGIGGFEMREFTLRDGRAEAGRERPVQVRIARLGTTDAGSGAASAGTSAGAATGAATRLEGLEIGDGSGALRIASASLAGFSLAPTIAAMRAAAAETGPFDPREARRFTPALGTLRLEGLDADLPEPTGPPGGLKRPPSSEPRSELPARLRFGLRSAELRALAPLNGIPSESRFAVDGLTMAVPERAGGEGFGGLAGLGYRDLDLSWLVDFAWNEAAGEIAVREVSVDGKDMGRARLTGTLAGLGRDIFDLDSAVATVALLGGAAKRLDLRLEDRGLVGRLLEQQARQQRRSAEDVRRDLGAAAAVAIPSLLGGTPSARSLGQAIARFIAKPGTLSIAARAKSPAGLAFADIAATREPTTLLDQLDIDAAADPGGSAGAAGAR